MTCLVLEQGLIFKDLTENHNKQLGRGKPGFDTK